MYRFIHTKSWRKGQILLRLLVSLFILTVFIPELSQASQSIPVRIAISPYCQNYAVLPLPFRADDNLSPAKRHDGDIYWRVVTGDGALASLGAYQCLTPQPDAAPNYDNRFLDSIVRRGFRQACQLLDLPPPCRNVSAAVQNSI